jgi:hypothetical protein
MKTVSFPEESAEFDRACGLGDAVEEFSRLGKDPSVAARKRGIRVV